jgi:hypothetical protein
VSIVQFDVPWHANLEFYCDPITNWLHQTCHVDFDVLHEARTQFGSRSGGLDRSIRLRLSEQQAVWFVLAFGGEVLQ